MVHLLNKSILLKLAITIVVFSLVHPVSEAQNEKTDSYDSLLADYLAFDSLLLDELVQDSSALFGILDDLISQNYLKSQLTVRIGYNSDILNAGRNFGVSQFGLNTGFTYYHKSGIFADVSGFYNSDLDPKYNATTTTAGYMGSLGKRWGYYLSYDHYFYTSQNNEEFPIEYPLTNSLNGSFYYQVKKFSIGADYSFLFGEETAHRIRSNISYTFSKTKLRHIDRLAFSPNISFLLGNANITSTVFNRETAMMKSEELIEQIGRVNFFYLFNNDREQLKQLLSDIQTNDAFGVMNYSIYLPVSLTIKKTTFLLSYAINFPVALPGEENFDTSVNGYLSASILFNFSL